MLRTIGFGFGLIAVISGCTETSDPLQPDSGPMTGEEVYAAPLRDGNSFACATCHALEEPALDGIRRPGHQIGDAANRATYKNGQLDDLLEAVNTCVTEWMQAPAWETNNPRWIALRELLQTRAGSEIAPDLTIEQVDPPANLAGGDVTRGRSTFNESCSVCHGTNAVGTNRAPSLVGADLDAPLIARRVRTSGAAESPIYPNLTGGVMPFWAEDRLSDDELRDVIAYVEEVSVPVTEDAGVGVDAGVPPADGGPSGCGSTHPRIGQIMDFSTLFHDVSGRAEILDDCTIRVDDFNYDARGIDVRFYGGIDGDYVGGFAIGEDLVRASRYLNETLFLTLPVDRTLDDLNGLSVWCVDVSVSFGDGQFRDP